MGWQHSICFRGDNFFPSKIPFTFTAWWDPNTRLIERGASKGTLRKYGYADYQVPASVPYNYKIIHLAETFVPLLPLLKENGLKNGKSGLRDFTMFNVMKSIMLQISKLLCGCNVHFVILLMQFAKMKSGHSGYRMNVPI